MTDEEVVAELRKDSALNVARRAFSSWSAKIDQAQRQSRPAGPIQMRRMEFEAVTAIIRAYTDTIDKYLGKSST